MQPRILLNEQIFHFTQNDFPLLIHGIEHSGSSFFTLALLTDLYNQNKKFIFFCKSDKAQINFLQLLTDQTKIGKIANEENIQKTLSRAQGILIKPSDNALFLSTVKQVAANTIIIVKNIDNMPEEIFDAIKNRQNVVISGNIDRCMHKEKILEKQWNTKILFSSLNIMMSSIPPIEQYEAIFLGQKTSGVISIK